MTLAGKLYLPSMMCVRTSLAVPHAKGDRPVIIMKRITPRLHTSGERERERERERESEGEREREGWMEGGREGDIERGG